MALNINIPRTGVSPQDQLRDMMSRMDPNQFGAVPVPTRPTEEVVGEQLDQFGQPVEIPRTDFIAQRPTVQDEESLAQAAGFPMAREAPRGRPVLDEQGNVVRDENGNPVIEQVPMEDFGLAQNEAVARSGRMYNALEGMSSAITSPVETARTLLESANTLSPEMAARQKRGVFSENVDSDTFSKWADSTGSLLDTIHNRSMSNLFSLTDAVVRSDGPSMAPIGLEIGLDEGMIDMNAPDINDEIYRKMGPVATVLALSHMQAVGQSRRTKEDASVYQNPKSQDGAPMDDAMYMSDMVDATAHSMRNALDRLGVKMKPENIRKAAMAQVVSSIHNGEHVAQQVDGRTVLTSSPQLKNDARNLTYLTEALTGDTRRMMPSDTPLVGGATFDQGRPNLSKNAKRTPGMVTRAADVTKDILGSVGYIYRKKDVDYKKRELEDIKANMVVNDFEIYSTSIFAERNKVSKKDFDVLMQNQKVPRGYDPNSEASRNAFIKAQQAHAREEIQNKLKTLEYDLMNAEVMGGRMKFMAWSHAQSNQRFFPASAGMDYMSSKDGVRDMLGVALQDAVRGVDLFDPNRVEELKAKFISILMVDPKDRSAPAGLVDRARKRHDALMKLTPAEQGAIGAMFNAVINYYSATGPQLNRDIVKLPEAEVIKLYTPEIGNHLASLGKEYNAFMDGDTANEGNIRQHLASMERGESLGNKNLWDDMFQLKSLYDNPAMKNQHYQLTHHGFDDGNQNGIFLQSLFFGNTQNAKRLGTFNPSLADMRGYAMNQFSLKLDEIYKDKPEMAQGWRSFFKGLIQKQGAAKVASDLFKVPLMQNAYGKDASMFSEHMLYWLNSHEELVAKHLRTDKDGGTNSRIVDEIYSVMDATLREIIDDTNVQVLKAIGRHSAMLGTVLKFPGASGDTQFFTSVGMVPQWRPDSEAEVWRGKDGTIMKYRKPVEVTVGTTTGERIAMQESNRDFDPAATKGDQEFYNPRTGKHDIFNNPLGTAQARLGPVMVVQSLDGDLVKMTTLFVNNGRQVPLPVMWVHDSIISSPFGSLVYRNAYNNIAIPQAVPYMKTLADRMVRAYEEGKQETFRRVDQMEAVGIGEQGEFPAVGAYFDELWRRIQPNDNYKQVYLKRNKNDSAKWAAYVRVTNEMLKDAEKAGWKPPYSLPDQEGATGTITGEKRRRHLAVTPDQFKELINIAAEGASEKWNDKQWVSVGLGLAGPKNRIPAWKANFSSRVESTFKDLARDPRVKQYGIGQMTPTGGNPPASFEAPNKKLEDLQVSTGPVTQIREVPRKKEIPDPFKDVPF